MSVADFQVAQQDRELTVGEEAFHVIRARLGGRPTTSIRSSGTCQRFNFIAAQADRWMLGLPRGRPGAAAP